MKITIFLLTLLSFSYSFPHFIYDGIESFHDCSGEIDKIYFSIHGSLTEEINPNEIILENYLIDEMGEFQCSLELNKESEDEKRTHKIVCRITGNFERKGYVLEEPKVHGFDFKDEKGETTWPKEYLKKMFLIGKCGEKIEVDNEPILLGNSVKYVNPMDNVRKDVVEKALSDLPNRADVNMNVIINSMQNLQGTFSLSQAESAYMVYRWVTHNIKYDCYNYNHNPSQIDRTEQGTYEKGKGVCAGYSRIFATMCSCLDVEAEYISGNVKEDFEKGYPTKSTHAWNAIKVGQNYYLVDTTWGAGICDGDYFSQNYQEWYFCPDPSHFIRSHYPSLQKWQLLSPPITPEEFVNMIDLGPDFYNNGFISASPDSPQITSDGKFTIKLEYKSEKQLLINMILEEEPNVVLFEACWTSYHKTNAEINCFTNKKGKYHINIFEIRDSKTYFIIGYSIISTQAALVPKGFPTCYNDFALFHLEVVEPFYNPLIRGTFIKFKFKSNSIDNLHISTKYERDFEYNGNGEFTAEDVYIVGDEMYIATIKDGVTHFLMKYTTTRNANQPVDATYPKSYASPKTILYSPLYDTLQTGKNYFFEIKNNECAKIYVIEGNLITYLSQQGSKFSGYVKINGISKEVHAICVSPKDSLSYLYIYKTK